MKRTLIVVDMQNDFITGPLGSAEAKAIVPKVKAKIQEYFAAGEEILFSRDTHYKNYLETPEGKALPVEHCIFGTAGWQIAEGLETPNCVYIDKETFGWTLWNTRQFDEIELVGVCTDICVVSNALILKAQFPNVKISVDASCCAGVTPESHKSALSVMKNCQINVTND